jgi:hypothetical protein
MLSYDPHATSRLEAQDVEELFSVVSSWIQGHTAAPEAV